MCGSEKCRYKFSCASAPGDPLLQHRLEKLVEAACGRVDAVSRLIQPWVRLTWVQTASPPVWYHVELSDEEKSVLGPEYAQLFKIVACHSVVWSMSVEFQLSSFGVEPWKWHGAAYPTKSSNSLA